MYDNPQQFIATVAGFLGGLYALAAGLNLAAAASSLRGGRRAWGGALAWGLVAAGFLGGAVRAFQGRPPLMPEWAKQAIDACLGPIPFTLAAFSVLAAFYVFRRVLVRPAIAWATCNAAILLLGLSLTDREFTAVVSRADNVPIVGMVFLIGLFVWLGAWKAVENDRRAAGGLPPAEKELSGRVLVWPDLVYIELICMVLLLAGLVAWSILLPAPLEQPANPVVTPNPAKAPWYFLGLQEMLVFFDASIAGVIFPLLIIFGLAAIPYLDQNPRGNGYYTIAERPFAYAVFQFGFLQLWILLILIGTFFRGPSWGFFGLYEIRDFGKVEALGNVTLATFFWDTCLEAGLPRADLDHGMLKKLATIFWREAPGIVLLAGTFLGLPALLGRTRLRRHRRALSRGRYWIAALLLLMMLMLPIKMLLRWTTGLSYIVSMPEYFFNF